MFWFGRPAYLRKLAAAVLIIGAATIEFWPTNEVPYPFTAAAAEAGEAIEVEWRMLPAGVYPQPMLTGVVASHSIGAGEPITASDLQMPVVVPAGWWALALEVPTTLRPGTSVQLVLTGDAVVTVPGVVVSSDEPDRFDVSGPTALIAIPAESSAAVAEAAGARQVSVLIAP